MALRLLFLGRLQDLAGAPDRSVEPAPGDTLGALIDRLEPELGEELRSPRVRIALNGTVLGESRATVLSDGDEIAFLPPVSGG